MASICGPQRGGWRNVAVAKRGGACCPATALACQHVAGNGEHDGEHHVVRLRFEIASAWDHGAKALGYVAPIRLYLGPLGAERVPLVSYF